MVEEGITHSGAGVADMKHTGRIGLEKIENAVLSGIDAGKHGRPRRRSQRRDCGETIGTCAVFEKLPEIREVA